jgi:hypothetical protein
MTLTSVQNVSSRCSSKMWLRKSILAHTSPSASGPVTNLELS